MEERMKVLKMLEEGKISADDAAKLLEALGEGPVRRHKIFFSPSQIAGEVADSLSSFFKALSEAIKEGVKKEKTKAK